MTGKYSIKINATGTFDSGNPSVDADALAKAFVDSLVANGSVIGDAKFCWTSTETCKDLVTGQTVP